MKRRILSIALALCLTLVMGLLCLPVEAEAATVVDSGDVGNLFNGSQHWELTDDGVLTVTGTGSVGWCIPNPWEEYRSQITEVVVGDGLTTIYNGAFKNYENLTKVTLGKDVTGIRTAAFEKCINLTTVVFSESLESISSSAFEGCTSLTEVTLPGDVRIIDRHAFSECTGLTKVKFCGTAETIGEWAFYNCNSLTEVEFCGSVDTIGEYAFYKCEKLKKVQFQSVREIGNLAFSHCNMLQHINLPEGLEHIGDAAFQGSFSPSDPQSEPFEASLVIPKTVSHLGEQFIASNLWLTSVQVDPENPYYCSDMDCVVYIKDKTELIATANVHLGEYHIPDTVVKIHKHAFDNGNYLTNLYIPASVTEIGNFNDEEARVDGFEHTLDAHMLQGIWVDEANPVYASDEHGVLFTKDGTWLLRVPSGMEGVDGVYEIPEGTVYLKSGCLAYNFRLKEVIIPDTVTKIYEDAMDQTSLTKITIPASVTEIGVSAFGMCYDLEKVVFAGDAPVFAINWSRGPFNYTTTTAYYPADNATWTEEVRQDYGGTITWVPYTGATPPEDDSDVTEPCKHTNTKVENAREATCTEDGYTGDTVCTDCGEMIAEGTAIEAPGHTEVIDPAVKATCTSTGLTQGKHCSVCDTTLIWPAVILKLPHSFEDGSCTVCGEADPNWDDSCKHTNTKVENAKEATCTEDGYTGDTVCADCGEMLAEGTAIEAPGHTEVIDPAVAATCTATGLTEGKHCSVCDTVLAEQTVVNMLPHSYENGTCAVCGTADPDWDTSCKHPYTVARDRKEATCTEDGYTGDVVCFICDAVITAGRTIEATGHTEVIDPAVDATCTASGLTEGKHCSVCDTVLAEQTVVNMLPHSYQNGSCTLCGKADPSGTVPQGEMIRLAGDNRFLTAILAADQMKAVLGVEKFDTIIVASGTNFADALSGSYLSAVKDAPILLSCSTDFHATLAGKYNDMVAGYIRGNLNDGGTVYILGGTKAVDGALDEALPEYNVKRLAGSNRYETNIRILEEAGVDGKQVLVCNGEGFADSLSASAAELPILLVNSRFGIFDVQKPFLASCGGSFCVIGGTTAVSEDVANQIRNYGNVVRLGGKNRFDTSVMIAEVFFEDPDAMVLSYAWNFPDGLCGGALAAAMDVPLILTMDCYEEQASKFAKEYGITRGFVTGTAELISDEALASITGDAQPGHDYDSETVAPTCTAGGYTMYTCQKCGHSYKDNKTPATGHSYETSVVYPTFDKGGYTKHTCSGCGHTKQTDKTEKLNPTLKEVLDLINKARAEAGVAKLSYYFEGQRVADIRAEEVDQYFSNTRPNGEDCTSLFAELELTRIPAWELLGGNYYSGSQLVNNWLASPDYREVLLDTEVTGLLVGRKGTSWVIITIV